MECAIGSGRECCERIGVISGVKICVEEVVK